MEKEFANKKVFLVISTAHFGDIILTNVLCRNIKKYESNAYIVFMANKPFVEVAQYMDGVDEVWSYDKKDKNKGLMGIYRFWKEYKNKYQIEASFVIYGNERGIFLSKLLGAKQIYGDRNKFPFNMLLTNGKVDYGNYSHAEDKNAYLYELYSGRTFDVMKMKYHVPQSAKKSVQERYKGKKKLIAINPLTKRAEKDLRIDMVEELIHKCYDAGMTPALLGVSDAAQKYYEGLPKETQRLVLNTVDQFTIPELGAFLQQCDALVTADTGTLHLGLALDVPTVAVYYENDPAWLAKWAPKPIYRHRLVAEGDYRAEVVWSNLLDLLKERKR